MSAPLSAELERELGAAPRQFSSLAHLLRWWVQHRPSVCSAGMEQGSGPKPVADRERERATMAAITFCTAERHPADLEDWPLSEWRVAALAHWLGSEEMGRVYIAERFGWSEQVCERFMGETASVLARRFRHGERRVLR